MLSIFQKVGCTIDPTFINECHLLGKNNGRVTVKFTHRKDCKQIFKVKKDLRDSNMEDLDLPRGTKIYVNQSLCSYYRILYSKAKRLQKIGSKNNFYIFSRTTKIKVAENSRPLSIADWMISRFIFLILICSHRQMHRSLGFIICCLNARYDISSSLLKNYVFYLFAFFVCLLVHV